MNNIAFDATKYYLGRLCKYGHEYEGTGQSLRVLHGDCVECKKIGDRNCYLRSREKSAVERQKKVEAKASERDRKRSLEALHEVDTECFKLGTLCANNHSWNNTGYSLRYKIQGSCVECRQLYIKEHYQQNKEVARARQKKYEARRPEVHQRAKAKYRETHREELRAKNREYSNRSYIKARLLAKSRTPEAKARARRYWQTEQFKLVAARGRQKRRAAKKQVHHFQYTTEELKLLYEKFDNACAYCGSTASLTVDHAVALSKGGSDVLGNLLPACMTCNCSKCDRDIEQWYQSQSFYTKPRWRKITLHLGWKKCNGQLSLF